MPNPETPELCIERRTLASHSSALPIYAIETDEKVIDLKVYYYFQVSDSDDSSSNDLDDSDI